MWGWYGPWDWVWMTFMMIGVWGVLIGGSLWAFRWFSRPGNRPPEASSARRILEERFARGEIDSDEFERRSELLASHDDEPRAA